MAKQVKIRIYTDGRVEAVTVGIKGPSCLSALDAIQDLVGGDVVSSERTAEYFESTEQLDDVIDIQQSQDTSR